MLCALVQPQVGSPLMEVSSHQEVSGDFPGISALVRVGLALGVPPVLATGCWLGGTLREALLRSHLILVTSPRLTFPVGPKRIVQVREFSLATPQKTA